MRIGITFTVLTAALLAVVGSAALTADPPTSASLMEQAYKQSGLTHKPVFVRFHATWCGWCKKFDAMLESPDIAKQFESNYVMVTLDVLENGDKKQTVENPGAAALLESLGGSAKGGIPFYAVLDANGKKLADSNAMPKGANIGYPSTPAEIDAFLAIVKKTAPHLTEDAVTKLSAYLKQNGAKGAANHVAE